MSEPHAPPYLFLSHSGADTNAALELKRRLLDSADARAAGLRVWLDKDDLAAGVGWQAQLEKVISEEATAFAVHVGGKGVVNWVASEVRLGLSRATCASDYPFIPILSKECSGSAALPAFARQYHGVRDPLNDPEEFAKLLRAVLRRSSDEKAIVLDSPFVGLKAMTEADADRFFGRNEEIGELVDKLKRQRLIAIVADSGAGKSSLAQAGLIPAFRGGALSDAAGREPDDRLWHVVVMRPRRDPIEGLKRGVTEVAERLGRSPEQCAALRKRIDAADPSETAYAIRCDLPVGRTETLLIVDQFEELLTETGQTQRGPFVDLLMALAAATGFRIVLTLRADHFNLCRPLAKLYEHLTRDGYDAVLRLRRITDSGIAEAVRNPLRLAGHTDVSEQDAVVASIRRDVSDRAGDLALVQMALYAMWQKHRADHVDLLVAYSQLGGVAGALAHEAEHVRTQRFNASEGALLGPIFVRLVRLGATGGATRRAADLADFEGPHRALIAKLATEECGRLLFAGEKSVEVAHEALITQWPWLQNTLNEASGDMRVLDRLMDKAHRWNTIGSRRHEHLATGAEREEFTALIKRHQDWLSGVEGEFVASSDRAYAADEQRKREEEQRKQHDAERQRAMAKGLAATAAVLVIALIGVAWFWRGAKEQFDRLQFLQSRFLADRADQRTRDGDAGTAMLLALEALPDIRSGRERPLAHEAEAALFRAYQSLQESVVLKGHKGVVRSATFTPDGRRVVTASDDNTARVWDAENGELLAILEGHTEPVLSAALSPNGRQLVTSSADHTARLWNVETGKQSAILQEHSDIVRSAAFSPDGGRVVTASDDRTARVWNAQTGKQTAILEGHDRRVRSAAFSPDGRQVLTASDDTTARLWDAETGNPMAVIEGHTQPLRSAAFSPDGTRVIVTTSRGNTARLWNLESGNSAVLQGNFRDLQGHSAAIGSAAFSRDGQLVVTASGDKTARIWDAQTARQVAALGDHGGAVNSAAFSPDGHYIVTASDDRTARLWDAGTGKLAAVFSGHLDMVWSAAFSPDGSRILTTSSDGTARLWSVKTGKASVILDGHASRVQGAAFAPGGRRVVTASDDSTARIWDAQTGKQTIVFEGHLAIVRSAVFSPDGRHVVTASDDKTARVWDAQTGNQMIVFEGHTAVVWSAAFSSDGQHVVTACDDKTARVWDAQTGRQTAVLGAHREKVRNAAFSPDGLRVVTASWDNTARLWDAESGKPTALLEGHEAQVLKAAFSPNGRLVLTASSDNTARLWQADTGKLAAVLRGHTGSVWNAAFSPDGKEVVTASDDNTGRLWDVETGDQVGILEGHDGPVSSVEFSPDGEHVVTGAWDNTARIWRVFPTPQAMVDQSKAVVPRCLTGPQRKHAFLAPEPPVWCIERKMWPY